MSAQSTKLEAIPGSPYRILGAIHRGGMGEILLARAEGAEGFSRKLVLKGLLPQLANDAVSHDLFRREAMLMARLEHPNIVRVVDFTSVEGQPFLAMEYIRGRNFHQVIQRSTHEGRRVPLKIALAVLGQALRGLHYAHHARDAEGRSLGIVHRDVSPGNILVSFFGEVKVTDFGIALAEGAQKHTGPRTIRGKARYTAPEIIGGKPASIQSDIFAAGVVLAEALLGEPLFERGGLNETLMAIVSETRESVLGHIFSRVEEVPGMRAVFRRCLARRPADRFTSALEMAEALLAVEKGVGGPVTQVELGAFLRATFRDARDLPSEDGLVELPEAPAHLEPNTDPSMAVPVSTRALSPRARPDSLRRRDRVRGPNFRHRKASEIEEIVEGEEPTAAEPRAALGLPPQPIAIAPVTAVPRRSNPPAPEKPRLEIVDYIVAADDDVVESRPVMPPPAPMPANPPHEAAFAELLAEARRSITDEVRPIMPSVPPPAVVKPRNPWLLVFVGILIGAATALGGSLAAALTN